MSEPNPSRPNVDGTQPASPSPYGQPPPFGQPPSAPQYSPPQYPPPQYPPPQYPPPQPTPTLEFPAQTSPHPPAGYPPPAYPAAYQPGQPVAYPPGYGPPVAPQAGMNGFAVASFVLSLCGGTLLGLIFGLIALRQIKRNGQRGRGFAVAGVVISSLWFAAIAVAVVILLATEADRNASGQITNGGRVSISALAVGDCVNDVVENKRVLSLPAVPCAQPHDAEVFAIFELTGSTFPSESVLSGDAEDGCVERFEQYAPNAADDPSLELFYFAPDSASWARGDREVVCLALDPNTRRTGSLRA